MQLNWHPRIRSILIFVNLAVLITIVAGVNILRVFETNLIRQTETALNIQAIFVSALYKETKARIEGRQSLEPVRIDESEVTWQPVPATLDKASSVMFDEQPKALSYVGKIDVVEKQTGLELVRILQEVQTQSLASIRLVNKDAVVISSTNLSHYISLSNRPEVTAALAGEHQALLRKRNITQKSPGAFSISRRAEYRIHVAHPIKVDGEVIAAVVLSRTPESLSQLLERQKFTIALYFIFILFIVWLLASFTSYSIRRPIDALVEQAKKTQEGKKGAVTPLKNPVSLEVKELSFALANMAKTLEERADYLIEFSSHISHEFKSPVTAIQGAIELLIDHGEDMTPEERCRFMSNIQSDSVRIENLVYRLLDLAKADLVTSGDDVCDVLRTTQDIVSSYRHNTEESKSVSIRLEENEALDSHTLIRMNQQSYSSVVRNLIDNALQANATEVVLEVSDSEYIGKKNLLLQVEDNGDVISEDNQSKIFDPFFTTHRNSGGTGLGLSIIKSILSNIGGDISLSVDGDIKRFNINIPIKGE